MIKTVLSYLATALIGALLMLWLWPRKTVTVHIPPTQSEIDSLAIKKFELRMANVVRVFENPKAYQDFLDSLKKKNKIIVKVPVPVLGQSRIDTLLVNADCPCVPEAPGQEFSAPFEHRFAYPSGDTSQVRVSLRYSQFNWPLHPSGAWKDVKVFIPPISKTVEVPEKPGDFLSRLLTPTLGKIAYLGAGLGLGYGAAKL